MIHYVTSSQMSDFKNCRRKWELSYREMLKPVQESEALAIGSSYHAKVEEFLKTGSFTESMDYTDAMARAFINYIYPQYPEKVTEVEQSFDKSISRGIHLLGKIDGRTKNFLIEHKTTSESNLDAYQYKVNFMNDQVSNYLIANGKNIPIIYDVIRKPTIRIKKTETLEEYIARCDEWYAEDTESKLRVFEVYRTDDELKNKKKEIVQLAKEMKKPFIYKNSASCSLYGNCPFRAICNSNDLDNLNDFVKKGAVNEELQDAPIIKF